MDDVNTVDVAVKPSDDKGIKVGDKVKVTGLATVIGVGGGNAHLVIEGSQTNAACEGLEVVKPAE